MTSSFYYVGLNAVRRQCCVKVMVPVTTLGCQSRLPVSKGWLAKVENVREEESMLKFIHATDLHLVTVGELLHGLDPPEQFQRFVSSVSQNHRDAHCIVECR